MADQLAAHEEGSADQPAAGVGLAATPANQAGPPARPDLGEVIAEQERIFIKRQPESAKLAVEAREVLAGGVTSSWQIARPQPVWLSHGQGSKVYDVDGNEYVDLHGGYGVVAGRARAPGDRRRGAATGSRAAPTSRSRPRTRIVVAEELAGRFGLPLWRFANSGTEATMDAVHLMRAITGRDLIIKVEGSYHGHHDSVQVSVYPSADELGPPSSPTSVPASTGIPRRDHRPDRDRRRSTTSTRSSGCSREHRGQIAGMILEPIMMNAGIILPEPGYLAGAQRPAARARRAARLRRGQDRPHRRARRRDRAVRRDARHHLPGQGDRRRGLRRRDRRHATR